MIININKAILHICNTSSGVLINSDNLLDISQATVNNYISNHIERAVNNPSLCKGILNQDSGLLRIIKNYLSNNLSFVNLSQYISGQMYSEYKLCKKPQDFDVLVVEFSSNEKKYIGFLKLKGKNGYIHEVMHTEGEIFNNLTAHNQILPYVNQNIDECAFISIPDYEVRYISKQHIIDGERCDIIREIIVGCTCVVKSSKEVMDDLKTQIKKTSEPVENMLELNECIRQAADSGDDKRSSLSYKEIAEKVFQDEDDRNDFLTQSIKSRAISSESDRFEVDEYLLSKGNEKIKIETDTGCEIKFPAHLYNNQNSGLVINRDTSGMITIVISGVEEYKLK